MPDPADAHGSDPGSTGNSWCRCRSQQRPVHRTGGDAQPGEQRGRAVADVVVDAPLRLAGTHRQERLGAIATSRGAEGYSAAGRSCPMDAREASAHHRDQRQGDPETRSGLARRLEDQAADGASLAPPIAREGWQRGMRGCVVGRMPEPANLSDRLLRLGRTSATLQGRRHAVCMVTSDSCGFSGTTSRKVLPSPGFVDSSIRPPSSLVARLARASPSPLPPVARCRAASTR